MEETQKKIDNEEIVIDEFHSDNLVIYWNDKLEDSAKDIGEASKAYKLMHIDEARISSNTYQILMVLGIILGPLAGIVTSIGTSISSFEESDKDIIAIISIVLSFLSGIIVSVIRFGNYDEVSESNRRAAARYTSIESNVRRQLNLYRNDRVPSGAYVEWLEHKFEELYMAAPLLPSRAYDNLAPIAKQLGICIPGRYEAHIEINSEYEENKISEVANSTIIEVNNKIIETPDDEKDFEIDNSKKDTLRSAIQMVMAKKDDMKGEKSIKRTSTLAPFSELNTCSDKMFQYEMRRFMGFQ